MKFRKGFTLIELMIAIFILVMGIVGVLSLFPIATQAVKLAEMITIATQLGQAKIEEMTSKSYEEISSLSEAYGEILGFEAFKRVTEVSYYDPPSSTTTDSDLGIKKVTVTVFWKSPLGITEKNINIVSLIAKR